MKRTIVIILIFCGAIKAYSQTDSLFLKDYSQKIIENNKLKNDLSKEKQRIADLRNAYNRDTLNLQKQIKDLNNEISSLKRKNSDLQKDKIKVELDGLQTKVDSLNNIISTQKQIIVDKDRQIRKGEADEKIAVENAKKNGKDEAYASIVDFYKNRRLDSLIESSSEESVSRDMQLLNNNPEIKQILNDLQIYFHSQKLLSQKFDAAKIKNAQMQLSQLKNKSYALDALKDKIDFYKDFNIELKETINLIIKLDAEKSAQDDSEIKKMKFNDIVLILSGYMYNYYDYTQYPYLSDVMIEIIKRKKLNPDAEITDLLKKLE